LAAEQGNLAIATALLQHGADPNRRDKEQRTPLFVALLGQHPDVAEALIRAPMADLRLATGYPPLFWAHQLGYEQLAALIEQRLR
jgi:ankyrin repeat protein